MARLLPPDAATMQQAAAALRRGELVAFPTETVYGLGADATSDRAVARIFEAKERPRFNPLIVHVSSMAMVLRLVQWNDLATRLGMAFWPGPLTLVLPRKPDCPASLLCSAGLDSLAIRYPSHPAAQALLTAVGRPLAAPSANRSGNLSPTRAEDVAESLGSAVDIVIDDGPCKLGLESTVVDLTGPVPAVLRPGAITSEALAQRIGSLTAADGGTADMPRRSPGQLESHYAPRKKLRTGATEVAPDEALLAFGSMPLPGARVVLNLSARGDLGEAAANLFAMLRDLDRTDARAIAVMPIPERALGEAINDRLRRASAPR